MKRGCILLALLAGCPAAKTAPDAGPVDAGPAQLTEQEPNDRPEDALSLTDSAVVSAQLETNPSKPDEDWYLLAPSSPRTVDLTVSGIPGADVALDVYDVDRNRLLTLNSEGIGKPERLPNLGVKSRLYLKVYSARKGAGGAYTLSALFREPVPGFEWEPNDRA
ncbi:MAG TPA: ABC transporter substrate-binding protein, partial [Myxococcaceae bacterium]|nr:ABC transporter substrate-binding protein [Myxococcaceae bacterium]